MAFLECLQRLFEDGVIELQDRPTLEPREMEAVRALLSRAFATYSLDLGGPGLEFDVEAALAATHLVLQAAWFYLVHDEPPAVMEQALRFGKPPAQPEAHLSADLLLRYLPWLVRRARASAPSDPLHRILAQHLRYWPLSGVLADLEEPPLTPPEQLGHPGLWLLYAERLLERPRVAWVPQAGAAREWVERVFEERKQPLPLG
jgi:hypothetical protein